MKLAKGLIATVTAIFAFTLMTASVYAAGQIERGNIYVVKNESQGTAFADTINAACNNTLRFSVHLHNVGPEQVVNARVRATLPGGLVNQFTSTVTITADNIQPATVTDTASVNLSAAGNVSYIGGSTRLLDVNGNPVSNLPDGITQTGVVLPSNIGVSVDQSRFVQFRVKIDCPTPPPTPEKPPKVVVKKEVVREVERLPVTGPGSVAAMFTGVSALAGIGHYLFRRYL